MGKAYIPHPLVDLPELSLSLSRLFRGPPSGHRERMSTQLSGSHVWGVEPQPAEPTCSTAFYERLDGIGCPSPLRYPNPRGVSVGVRGGEDGAHP